MNLNWYADSYITSKNSFIPLIHTDSATYGEVLARLITRYRYLVHASLALKIKSRSKVTLAVGNNDQRLSNRMSVLYLSRSKISAKNMWRNVRAENKLTLRQYEREWSF